MADTRLSILVVVLSFALISAFFFTVRRVDSRTQCPGAVEVLWVVEWDDPQEPDGCYYHDADSCGYWAACE